MDKHLWEVKHSYYCNEGNYRSNECLFNYESLSDFFEEWDSADLDYNLLIRWDWLDKDSENLELDEEDQYNSDLLKIFWVLQRKGDYLCTIVKIKKEEESKVIEFLKPRLNYMKNLWLPFK